MDQRAVLQALLALHSHRRTGTLFLDTVDEWAGEDVQALSTLLRTNAYFSPSSPGRIGSLSLQLSMRRLGREPRVSVTIDDVVLMAAPRDPSEVRRSEMGTVNPTCITETQTSPSWCRSGPEQDEPCSMTSHPPRDLTGLLLQRSGSTFISPEARL